MASVFGRISCQLHHIYLLSYTPTIEPGENDWRRIDVRFDEVRDAHERANSGYFP